MRLVGIIILVLCIVDGIWGGSTLIKELIPYTDQTKLFYNILAIILAIVLSSVLAGTIFDHLEKHVISKIFLKQDKDNSDDIDDDDIEDVDLDSLANLGSSEDTVKL